ncbi:MAG: DUF3313 family protein [Gammaproteobacteria bacterium]
MQGRQLNGVLCVLATLVLLFAASVTQAREKWPATSTDGLELVPNTKVDAVYRMPGATLAPYRKVVILDCAVAFAKNWERDFNRDSMFSDRVTAKDMDRIRKALSDEFRKIFTQELQARGGYEIVDAGGKDVLILRPAIVNLMIVAPDVKSPNMNTTFSASGGAMTLYMEFYDSMTNALIGRVLDSAQSRDSGLIQVRDSVTNKQDADQILRKWAKILVAALDEAAKKAPASG